MIHVINRYNRHLYENILESMFQVRHKVFVEHRGWKKLEKKDGLEIDQFDTLDTTYFLKLSTSGEVVGGVRMYPTNIPTQLNTIFKDTCVFNEQPADPTHYEWSRYFITDIRYRSATRKPIHQELYMGVLEYASAMGIKSLSGFIETATFVRIGRMPWEMKQLGIPHEYGGTDGEPVGYGLPTMVTVNSNMVEATKSVWQMLKPVLSLSLGARNLPSEIGFNAKIIIAIQEFVRQHRDHIDSLLLLADMLNSSDTKNIETVNDVLGIITKDEVIEGFDPSLAKKVTHRTQAPARL